METTFKPTRQQINRAKFLANSVIGNAAGSQKLAGYGYMDLADQLAKNANLESELAFALSKRVSEQQ